MDFLKTLMISSAGLKVQTGRMRIIAENVANADSVASTPGGDPYRRQIPTVTSKFDKELGAEMVRLGQVVPDRSDFEMKYEPNSPAADASALLRLVCDRTATDPGRPYSRVVLDLDAARGADDRLLNYMIRRASPASAGGTSYTLVVRTYD